MYLCIEVILMQFYDTKARLLKESYDDLQQVAIKIAGGLCPPRILTRGPGAPLPPWFLHPCNKVKCHSCNLSPPNTLLPPLLGIIHISSFISLAEPQTAILSNRICCPTLGVPALGLDKICLAKFEQNGQPKERSNSASKMGCQFCQKSKMGKE